jgi:hypothetical protein
MDSPKLQYINFCSTEGSIPIFSKHWWLDAVCGKDSWDVALVEKGGSIMASMPYLITENKRSRYIRMPLLTQTLGPYIVYPENQKYEKRIAFEKEVMTGLINQLPAFDHFSQRFHYSTTNWLPFYWSGFHQTTRYTYVIDLVDDLDSIFSNFGSNIKSDIRKAKKIVHIKESDDVAAFYNLIKSTFGKQGKEMPYSIDLLKTIDQTCAQKNCRKLFIAYDKDEVAHAGAYIIFDQNSAYYLIGGRNTELKNSGATSLVLWHAIQFASTVTDKFDFEGSMLEPVERFFRAFGAQQVPYFSITKTNSRKLKLKESLGEIKRTLLAR